MQGRLTAKGRENHSPPIRRTIRCNLPDIVVDGTMSTGAPVGSVGVVGDGEPGESGLRLERPNPQCCCPSRRSPAVD